MQHDHNSTQKQLDCNTGHHSIYSAMKLQTLKPRISTASLQRVAPSPAEIKQTATSRGYNYAWQQARLRFLKDHPLCVMCQREGRVGLAEVVDHVIPHRGDQGLFWDRTNWQPLCKRHHDSDKQRAERAATRIS